jgi:hypothetical protein
VFGDDVVAAAMIDRLVHHAEVIALEGDSYRLNDRDLGRVPTAATDDKYHRRWSDVVFRKLVSFRLPLTPSSSERIRTGFRRGRQVSCGPVNLNWRRADGPTWLHRASMG